MSPTLKAGGGQEAALTAREKPQTLNRARSGMYMQKPVSVRFRKGGHEAGGAWSDGQGRAGKTRWSLLDAKYCFQFQAG